ncbi:MAG: succinyl-diaminopimelate desuccinylase [Alphaproteobacteria bacterium]
MPMDAVALSQALIRCPSVTPEEAGALGIVEVALKPAGFDCTRLRFEAPGSEPVENLYARFGASAPNFCFAGHVDVVPPGDVSLWRHDPFGGEITDGKLYGRGAVDMKTGVAAFAAAAAKFIARQSFTGSISLLVTCDEEGPAMNGTARVLSWLREKNEKIDHALVGEPTGAKTAGDTIKIGRRGSMNVRVSVRGVQGHSAYPQGAINPIPVLAEFIGRMSVLTLDAGSEHFEPSTLAFTSVDVGNRAANVIPALAHASFNIRYNDQHTPDTLLRKIETAAREVGHAMGGEIGIEVLSRGEVFLTRPGAFTDLLRAAVNEAAGFMPQLSTSGGTSDARYLKDYCPVAELGLAGRMAHKTDECVAITEIEKLTRIYEAVLSRYFANPPR